MYTKLQLKTYVLTAFTIILLLAIDYAPTGAVLEYSIARPWEFYLRSELGLESKLSPRLKIIAFENNSVDYFNAKELDPEQMATLIDKILEQKPRSILLDKVFGISMANHPGAAHFQNAIYEQPVIAAAIAQNSPMGNRPKSVLSERNKGVVSMTQEKYEEDADKITYRPYFYGPHHFQFDWFRTLGHIVHHGRGYISPYVAVPGATANEVNLIPYIGLHASDDITFTDEGATIRGAKIPIQANQLLLPNLRRQETFLPNLKSAKSVFQSIAENKPLDWIEEGDIVVYLPSFYSGGTDFKETVNGRMPGGLILAAVANSTYAGDWLKPLSLNWLLIIIACLLSLFTLKIPTRFFWPWFIGLCTALLILGFGVFLMFASYFSWHLALGGCGIISLGIHIMRYASRQKHHLKVRASLGGFLTEQQLEIVEEESLERSQKPNKSFVSVMFIDLAGFSLYAEDQDPIDVFNDLKDNLKFIFEEVHNHGGFINKTLGDGVLAFFSDRYGSKMYNHPVMAVKCAIAIQEANFARSLNSASVVHPLRIGINTASVCIGDLGNSDRIDINIIGHGVNFCKRLEDACEPFRIMMSPLTRELIADSDIMKHEIHKRYAAIKHHSMLFDAFEVNPFLNKQREINDIMQRYFKSRRFERKFDRLEFSQDRIPSIVVNGEIPGQMLNLSVSGAGILCDKYLAKSVIIEIDIKDGSSLKAALESLNALPIRAQVVSGVSRDERFYLGIKFVGLSSEVQQTIGVFTQNGGDYLSDQSKKSAS